MGEIAAYKSKLHEALKKEMAEPISCKSVSNCTMLMEAICAADKLSEEPSAYARHFDRETAMRWTEKMENADDTVGPHWSLAQTEAYAQDAGVAGRYDKWVWFAAMNKEYSDGIKTAIKYGINRPEYFIDRAIEFLDDKDGPKPEEKLALYYKYIVCNGVRS